MGNRKSKQKDFNYALKILKRLSSDDLKYYCLVFLDEESYYAMTKVLGIPLKIKHYYIQCENELLNRHWTRYYKLCKSVGIPLQLHKHRLIPYIRIYTVCNSKEEYLEVFQYVYERDITLVSDGIDYEYMRAYVEETINYACVRGHLNIIKFLYSKGITCTDYGIEMACANGHLDIIKFLHSIGIPYTYKMMYFAYMSRYHNIVQFLATAYKVDIPKFTIDGPFE